MVLPGEQQMCEAIRARDSTFDGRFIYGVISTGVFCRPSCRSRTPRPENLRFFPDPSAAFQAGFRPCRRCHPLGDDPVVARLLKLAGYIEAHIDESLPLRRLAEKSGFSESHLQRRFKALFGLSPKQYQDGLRLQRFKGALREGRRVTDAIFTAGYGSTSRLYDVPERNLGMSPQAYRLGAIDEVIHYLCCQTPLGLLMMAATGKGVCFVQFGEAESVLLTALLAEFPRARCIAAPIEETPELTAWMGALERFLGEGLTLPEIPVDMRGTVFQIRVWRFLRGVKEGEVLSYSELARKIGSPKAARAVGAACAKNRIGILIPCHRVLRGDGGLGGYRWGEARKRALLELEAAGRISG